LSFPADRRTVPGALSRDPALSHLPTGLASVADADLSNSPTLVSGEGTRMGVILGTASYMSPEQARGKAVDKRTDIFAFGCFLYEVLTGRRAFEGDDVTDISRENRPGASLPGSIGRERSWPK
jgi:serine/threonine protein kinase